MRTFAWTSAAAAVLLASVSFVVPAHAQDQSKLKPKDIPRLMEEADKFIAANDMPKAQAYLKAVIGLDPKQSQAAFKLGKLCEAQKDWECALTNYQLALGALTGADKAQAHMGLATGHLQAGRYADAAEHAGAALALDPVTHAGARDPCRIARQAEEPRGASLPARPRSRPCPTAPSRTRRSARPLSPRDEWPTRRRRSRRPSNWTRNNRPRVRNSRRCWRQRGDHAGTIAAATQALSADPGRKDLYALRGRAYLATGDEAKALQDLHTAAAANPNDKALLAGAGHAPAQAGATRRWRRSSTAR